MWYLDIKITKFHISLNSLIIIFIFTQKKTMNYLKIYNSIIDNSKNHNRKKNKITYYESHHIIPKCHGGSNLKHNIVLLTAKEHFICHKLLTYIYPSDKKLALAVHTMVYTNK